MQDDLAQAAIEYLKAGLHILALTGKKPNPRVHGDAWSWEDSFNGVPVTIAEANLVRDSFGGKGTTGIAILIPKGVLVADVDTERAAALLQELGWRRNEDSIIAVTKNGLHVWLAAPGADRNRWLGDGLEPNPGRTLLFKGFGGYVVAPPSLHFGPDGEPDGVYQWGANPLAVAGRLMLPDTLPVGAATRFAADDQFDAAKPERDPAVTFQLVPVEGEPWWKWPKAWDYNTAGLEAAIEHAADGNQNNVIHWAALTARDEGVPLEVAMERLLAAAIRGNHPKQRARDTIRGAYKRAPRG